MEVVRLPVARTPEAALGRIERLGGLLGHETQAAALMTRMAKDIAAVKHLMARKKPARALILLAAGDHGVMLGGHDTAAHSLLQSLGLRNALPHISGYKPASREGLLASNPDLIVIAEARPGQFRPEDWRVVTQLEAWKQGHRVTANAMLLLGFGPRLAEAMGAVAAAVPEAGTGIVSEAETGTAPEAGPDTPPEARTSSGRTANAR